MARPIVKAKTSKVNPAARSASSSDAAAYGRDLDHWPRSWMGLEKDLPPGEELVACFRPFPRASRLLDACPEDHAPARGQPLAAGRRNHP